ncbi:jg16576 [Pararge aegeria aegeria]|uniref:Jg16576 protein n=1 Tax=Pararge aegeria aegeria TaxID=348720 RepID=A0A8S4RB98_9NEOP|nr:jg16576 [Pararge aegeria aegeria]
MLSTLLALADAGAGMWTNDIKRAEWLPEWQPGTGKRSVGEPSTTLGASQLAAGFKHKTVELELPTKDQCPAVDVNRLI